MRSSRLRLGAALLVTLASLVACRTVPPSSPIGASWEVRRPQLAVAAGGEGFNADLHWIQDGPRSQVTLAGPLGVGGAEITASGNDLTLVTSRGEHVDSDAAHAALAARLGFDPPLSSLRYWILGVPDPAQPAITELDVSQQRLTGLTQAGWRVDYADYVTTGGGTLPARLTLQRDNVRVRVLIDNWQS